ncbi:MAG: hypothetical protein G01um10147_901 [Microgenomates group bacterium Gr01-1014_7]|nr:MAG: hypothetical protein G01um10147_901 [Microgenomates group bacterium Gr01-1014_7]
MAIFKGSGGELILTGAKTIESRFSKAKIAPFGRINRGDLVYIKPAGKDIIGQFRVNKVIFFDGLDLSDLSNLRNLYESEIAMGEEYWKEKDDSRVGTLIFIGESSRFLTAPLKIPKKDLRGWVVLD